MPDSWLGMEGTHKIASLCPEIIFQRVCINFRVVIILTAAKKYLVKIYSYSYTNLALSEESLEKRPGSVWDSVSIFGKLLP